MKYLLITIFLFGCGDTEKEDIKFNGIDYMENRINNIKVVNNKLT